MSSFHFYCLESIYNYFVALYAPYKKAIKFFWQHRMSDIG